MAKYDWKIEPPRDESGKLTDKGLIVALVRHVGCTAKLARDTELSHTLFNDIYKGSTPVTKKTEDRIIATYPEINPKWVKDRTGPMLLELDQQQPAPQQPTPTAQPAQDDHKMNAPESLLLPYTPEAITVKDYYIAIGRLEQCKEDFCVLSQSVKAPSTHHDASPRGDKHKPGTGTDGLSAGLG
jgi:hypothetical protein